MRLESAGVRLVRVRSTCPWDVWSVWGRSATVRRRPPGLFPCQTIFCRSSRWGASPRRASTAQPDRRRRLTAPRCCGRRPADPECGADRTPAPRGARCSGCVCVVSRESGNRSSSSLSFLGAPFGVRAPFPGPRRRRPSGRRRRGSDGCPRACNVVVVVVFVSVGTAAGLWRAGASVRATSGGYLVDPASSHMLVSKTKPCMSKYKRFCTVKLRMAH